MCRAMTKDTQGVKMKMSIEEVDFLQIFTTGIIRKETIEYIGTQSNTQIHQIVKLNMQVKDLYMSRVFIYKIVFNV